MNWVLKLKHKVIVLLGGYTRDEVEKLYFLGIKDGRYSLPNYYKPSHTVIDDYDKTRSNRNC